MSDFSHLCGWDEANESRIAFAESTQTLFQAAPHLYEATPPDDIFLYKAWKEVLGSYPNYVAQAIGDCTSFSVGHSLDLLQCIQIYLGHQKASFKEICTEAIYGIGREIAGMLGRGDGCYGGAVAKAVADFGTTTREVVGPYSGQRAKQWGRDGVPDEIKATLGEHKIESYALIKTPDDAHAALGNLNPIIVCSNWGFETPRDSTGLCQPRGTWPHAMGVSAVRKRNGKRQWCIDQSWGKGQPQGPTADDQPEFSFWIDERPMAAMFAQFDSFALSAFKGFPGQGLPGHWTVGGFA